MGPPILWNNNDCSLHDQTWVQYLDEIDLSRWKLIFENGIIQPCFKCGIILQTFSVIKLKV
jgi:hypothetical protein